MRRLTTLLFFLLAILGSIHFSGCSGKSVEENDPASLLKDAEDDIKSDHYQVAIEKLRTIKNKFPYSNQSIEAHLRIADVYYMQESWAEAAATYESFRDLHPNNEKVPYAMFRIGKSYFNDIPGNVSRDLTPAKKALDAYQGFLKRFPNVPEATEARKDVETIREALAEKELYIGNFYFKRDYYASAKPRFEKVLELYPETKSAKEAKEKLSNIDYLIQKQKEESPKDVRN